MTAPLRVAVDAQVVATDERGIGRYARAILRRLLQRDDVALTLLLPELFPLLRKGALTGALDSSNFRLARAVPRDTAVTWFPANGAFFASRAPVVVTLHDAGPFRYPNPDPKAREREQQPFLRSVAMARSIIAVSVFGKSEIEHVFGADPASVTVVHHGIDEAVAATAAPLPPALAGQRYVLFVGQSERRKGIDVLIEAFVRAREHFIGLRLVLAGSRGDALPQTLPEGVIPLGVVSDAELEALYAHAAMLAFPSRYEGFGLPVLEAMSRGTPVIAAASSSIPEVAGDAAHLVPVEDASALASGIIRIATDEEYARALRARGLERAREFNWERSVEQTLRVLRAAAKARDFHRAAQTYP